MKHIVLTAFGETKSRIEWTQDPRCRVTEHSLMIRANDGWPPEASLVIPLKTKTHYSAFGTFKMLQNWLADARCAVPPTVLMERLAAGEPMETALTRPEPGRKAEVWVNRAPNKAERALKFEAFGEVKTTRAWSEDPRCTVSFKLLKLRISHLKLPIEAAMIFSRTDLHAAQYAFGETKCLTDWIHDGRCTTPGGLLQSRLASGEPFESAISRPASEGISPPAERDNPSLRHEQEVTFPELDDAYGVLTLTLFGETKTSSQWVEDPRCEVSYTTIRDRTLKGWPPDETILLRLATKSPFASQFSARTVEGLELGVFPNHKTAIAAIEANGGQGVVVHRFTGRETPFPRPPQTPSSRREIHLTAWGETKTLREWVGDERCKVGHKTLHNRITTAKAKHWDPEEAMTTPANDIYIAGRSKAAAKLYSAFGETKTLTEWREDPRCEVPRIMLAMMVRQGMPLELALRKQETRRGARRAQPQDAPKSPRPRGRPRSGPRE